MHDAHGRTSACDFALAYGVYTCKHVRGVRAYLSCVADDHIVVVQVLGSISALYRLYIGAILASLTAWNRTGMGVPVLKMTALEGRSS